MDKLKRVIAINDISGFGKCSLTVAIPILSAASLETCPVPTAILSTHTGGFTGYTYRDLTEDLEAYTNHWKSLDIKFSALYSGFLGSAKQVGIVSYIIDKFKTNDCIIMVDPCMADNGAMYPVFNKDMCTDMAKLVKKSDIVVPNLTEAAFLIGEEYKEPPYTKDYINHIIDKLLKLGAKSIVLTGVAFNNTELGAASYDYKENKVSYAFSDRVDGLYHGTGDVFASFLLASLLNNKNLEQSTQLAVDLTYKSIELTFTLKTPSREGVVFEKVIPDMIKKLGSDN